MINQKKAVKMKNILIIEDDRTILEGLEDTFKFHGFEVSTALNGLDGLNLFEKKEPDLIILDIMLPEHDGFEICKIIRGKNKQIPIIILTAKSQESDKLLGFELGADDYVTKPFSIKELLARVNAILKRIDNKMEKHYKIKNIDINFKNFELKKNDKTFQLSPKECEILELLVSNPNEVISRNRIIDDIWGDDYFPSPRTIDNFILKLRKKIEDNPKTPMHIITVHGAGYKFKF